jgi:hypothetical protein
MIFFVNASLVASENAEITERTIQRWGMEDTTGSRGKGQGARLRAIEYGPCPSV